MSYIITLRIDNDFEETPVEIKALVEEAIRDMNFTCKVLKVEEDDED
jgi:hypothetical protein